METFDKLVRDKIPEIIRKDNKIPKLRFLDESEYKQALLKKLIEESIEVSEAYNDRTELIKEIGDLLEVIDYTIKAFDLDLQKIEKEKKKRHIERGGFNERIYLESIE